MDSHKFEKLCKEWVKDYYKKNFDTNLEDKDVFTVWSCKTLQNNKALISTNVADGRYIECTHNGDNKEIYIDIYKKEKNIKVAAED